MNSEKKQVYDLVILMILIFIVFLSIDYFYNNGFFNSSNLVTSKLASFISKAQGSVILFRLGYIICVLLYIYHKPPFKLKSSGEKSDPMIYGTLLVINMILTVTGYIGISFYDTIIYPIVFFTLIYFSARFLACFKNKLNEESILGINSKTEGKFVFTFNILNDKQKLLPIPIANSHIYAEGTTRSGKSASIVKPFVYQGSSKGMGGLIYDYNGNPNEEGQPILTKTAFHGIREYMRRNPEGKTRLAFINFLDLTRSTRANPLSYINDKLEMVAISNAIMKNLERSWKEKTDFWAKNAIQIFTAAIHMLKKHRPDIADIPHAVALVMSPHHEFLSYIASDPEICRDFMPTYSAYVLKAEGQIAGAISSAQSPLTQLDNPNVFWVLGSDDVNLDVTNPENPTLLCIGNDGEKGESIAAAISAIMYVCQTKMNKPGRVPSIFVVDELPTIILYKFDEFIANCGKNGVSILLTSQTFRQLKRDYGQETAYTIRNTVGNMFVGPTGDDETAKYISEMIGTIKKHDYSFSESESTISQSERLQNEKALQLRDIMGQRVGHFTGRILGGEPPFFHCQFDYYKMEGEEKEIPQFAKNMAGDDKYFDEFFSEKVKSNYDKVYADINKILEKHRKTSMKDLIENLYEFTNAMDEKKRQEFVKKLSANILKAK